jgi:plastocyanin
MPNIWPARCISALSMVLICSAARAETLVVTVDDMAFSPAVLDAKVGDTVKWVNKDTFAHTATAGGWEVKLPLHGSGSIVVGKPQTIDYRCRLHPNMTGRIIVGGG